MWFLDSVYNNILEIGFNYIQNELVLSPFISMNYELTY